MSGHQSLEFHGNIGRSLLSAQNVTKSATLLRNHMPYEPTMKASIPTAAGLVAADIQNPYYSSERRIYENRALINGHVDLECSSPSVDDGIVVHWKPALRLVSSASGGGLLFTRTLTQRKIRNHSRQTVGITLSDRYCD